MLGEVLHIGGGASVPACGERTAYVQVLLRAMQLTAQIRPGRAVTDLDRHLDDAEPLATEIDGQRGLDAEPGRQRKRRVERVMRPYLEAIL